MKLNPFLMSAGAVVVALIIGFAIIIPTLNPPEADIRTLLLIMSITGSLTILLSYLLYQRGLLKWFTSLRYTVLATTIITVVLVFVNVWVTAQLMFISNHDLILTSALLVFGGVISVCSVFFFSGVITDRIHALSTAAERVAEGDLVTRLEVEGNDELAHLAKMFNQMADSLQQAAREKAVLEQSRRNLIAWVSHDLRTPLASIRAMNEAMIDGVVSDKATVQRYMFNTQNEVEHLSRMIDDLFELSQLDSGHLSITRHDTSIRDLISDTLGSMAARAEQNDIELRGNIDEDIDMVFIAADKVQRVFNNLLDNAFGYTPSGGKITLSAKRQKHMIEISVHNTGSYIQPEDLPHVFESFYKVERSRTKSKDGYRGTGLGLAIVRSIVEAHGGNIAVRSDEHRGTEFVFTLPDRRALLLSQPKQKSNVNSGVA